MKDSLGFGPDRIHGTFIKKCANTLSYPLFKLFNKSLSAGIFPKIWINFI